MIGGAEEKSELKGSIATWECQSWKEGRAEMEEERQKYRRLRITREVGEKAT